MISNRVNCRWICMCLTNCIAFAKLIMAVQPVADNGCALVNETIWCYGGLTSVTVYGGPLDNSSVTNEVIRLDLSNENAFNWQTFSPTPAVLDKNYNIEMLSIQNGQGFLIFGGSINVKYPVVTYNGSTNEFNATPNGQGREMHTATLSNNGSHIYIIGGWYVAGDQVVDARPALVDIWAFSTADGQWQAINASSQAGNTGRIQHTVVAIPNSSLMFIYGGSYSDSGDPIGPEEAALIFDYQAHHLYFPTIQGNGPLVSLSNHHCVVYTNVKRGRSFAVVLFGMDRRQDPTSTTAFLNLTEPGSLKWVANFSDPIAPSASQTNESNGENDGNNQSGLSSAATGGIVAAAAVVGIAGCVVLLIAYSRRRKNQQDFFLQQDHSHREWDDERPIKPSSGNPEKTKPDAMIPCCDKTKPFAEGAIKPSGEFCNKGRIKPFGNDPVKPFDQHET
ncbi:hypothetical protein BC940DRAFT_135714 [Gongronella butleri]|nr:hypothetical protein BC940DRAFT_135714 [Gongronella butleri]